MSQISSSPYSTFGIGIIEDAGFGVNNSMGGTGLAFKSHTSLNNLNPASYSGIDSLSFIFEFGMVGKHVTYEDYDVKQTDFNANLQYLALGFRVNRWWSTSLGIKPYSNINYTINITNRIDGTDIDYTKTFTGEGAVNHFYSGNAFRINKNISLGINASYFFGSITQVETYSILNYTGILEKTVYNTIYLDYGLQYSFKTLKHTATIGLVYGNSSDLPVKNQKQLIQATDTIDLETDEKTVKMPEYYGIGISVENPNKYRIGFDYETKDWTELDFSNPLLSTRMSQRISAGIEITPGNIIRKDDNFRRWSYRAGTNYNNTYLIIDDVPINSIAVTCGIGAPLGKSLNRINTSFEWGKFGTLEKGLILETYWLVHLNLSMHELWFRKRKFD